MALAKVRARLAARPPYLLHVLRLARFAHYDHVQPLRSATIGVGVRISPTASFRNGARIRIGAGSRIGQGCRLWAGDTTGEVVLGEQVLLGPDVFLTAANYALELGLPILHQPRIEKSVRVGAGSWLGTRVVVLPGVTIGEGCVVAAGAVVTKDLPSYTLAAGVPARPIGDRRG